MCYRKIGISYQDLSLLRYGRYLGVNVVTQRARQLCDLSTAIDVLQEDRHLIVSFSELGPLEREHGQRF